MINTKNKIQKGKEQIKLDLEVIVMKEGKYYVAYSPAFDVSSYGKPGVQKFLRSAFNFFRGNDTTGII